MVGRLCLCLEWERPRHRALDLLDPEEVHPVRCQEWTHRVHLVTPEEFLGKIHRAMGILVTRGKEGKGLKDNKVSAACKVKINCLLLRTLAKRFVHQKA